eukprot:SAG22_NODE_5322_length_1037_cov_1.528785_2_plen_120_part_01
MDAASHPPPRSVLAAVQQSLAPAVATSTAAGASGAGAASLPAGIKLHCGLELPPIGLGCGYNPSDPVIVEKGRIMLETALDCGYRHLDTAQRYGTEPAVGAALAARFAAGSLSRADVWVT